MNEIKKYSYLWDGSDPGWILNQHNEYQIRVVLRFSEEGPTKEEIVKIRKAVPDYREMSALDAMKALKGIKEIDFGWRCDRESQNLESNLVKEGLSVEGEGRYNISYGFFNEKRSVALLIEDEGLVNQLKGEAIKNGVEVFPIEA